MKSSLNLGKAFRFADSDLLLVKILIVLVFFALRPAPCALSQIPQGFTYQAVAFDQSGAPIRNAAMSVRISIESDSLGGTLFWQELHSSVTTNGSGMFSLVLGKGVKQMGDAATFADIDWSVTPKFIRVEIDYEGWKTIGASRLWSVPYAMAAGDISGTLSRLEVTGEPSVSDEALFEVKNKNGQTVFAVYNEGVRVNVGNGVNKAVKGGFAIGSFDESKAEPVDLLVVNRDSVRVYIYDDPLNKAVKGGFAIGGFDETKAPLNEYLRVSPDSVRVYIDKSTGKAVKGGFAIGSFDETKAPGQEYLRVTDDSVRVYIDDQSKAVKGGFAIGGFDETKTGGKSFFDVSTSSEGVIAPAENRILWYPLKNAFLTGRVLVEAPDSVGENSFASGYESKATGQYSQALGYQAIARGDNSTSIGYSSVAHKSNSFAFGNNTTASGSSSVALGSGANAKGNYSFALGSIGIDSLGTLVGNTVALEDYSFAIGQGASSNSTGAFAIGTNTVSNGDFSTALGYKAETDGYYALALGPNTEAMNQSAVAIGIGAKATGQSSIAIRGNASNQSAIAIGGDASSTGQGAISLGGAFWTYSPGFPNPPVNLWYTATASGTPSMALGYGITASGAFSIALGTGSTVFPIPSQGGTESIGRYSVAIGHYAHSEGEYSKAIGDHVTAYSAYETVMGRYNTTQSSSATSWVSTDPLFVIGNGTGSSDRSDAMKVLKNGNVYFPKVYSDPLFTGRDLYINSLGMIGYISSSRRYKTQIEDMENVDWLYKLKPVNFVYEEDSTNCLQYGLIAEEVENVNRHFVSYNEKGEVETVLYSRLVTPMLKAIQEQQQIIETQNLKIESQLQQINQQQQAIESLETRVEQTVSSVEELKNLRAEVEALKSMLISGNK